MTHKLIPFDVEHLYLMDLRDRDKLMDWDLVKTIRNAENIGVTYVIDDKPIASGGVIPMWEGVGTSWMACSKDYKNYAVSVGRYMLDTISSAFDIFDLRRIQATCDEKDEESIKFHEWAGYEKEGILKRYGIDGSNHIMFAKVKV